MSLHLKYFVLKPKGNSTYARASRAAMFAFCEAMQEHAHLGEDITLTRDVYEWALRETVEAVNEENRKYDGY
jgi:hypothetical protein